MRWNDMTIGKKIGIGFGLILILMVVLGLLSFSGVSGIVKNASEVIDGKALDGELAQKEVDHLNWVGEVNKLLTDDTVNELTVQTDHTKCGFGQWLYGEGRKQAETLVPSLAPLFKEIEEPHKHLHESAIAIGKVFKQADAHLPTLLVEREVDHLKWAAKIREAFVQHHDSLGVQTDPTKCALGKWIASDSGRKAYEKGDADFKRVWDQMVLVHKDLHLSAIEIESHLAYGQLARLEDSKKLLNREFEKLNHTLFSVLEEGMAKVIDPAKKEAERSQNIPAMTRWGAIDMVMNEEVIHTFHEARLAMSRFENEKTPETWADYQAKETAVIKGLDSWFKLVRGEPALETIVNSLNELMQTWAAETLNYHKAIMDAQAAENSIGKAIETFNRSTMPLLNQVMSHLAELREEAQHELSGMNEANSIYAQKTAPALKKVQTFLGELRKEAQAHILTDQAMLSAANGTKRNVSIIAVVALILGIFLAFVIARGIVSVLQKVTDGMNEGANQVAQAAGQVSSSSQSLAEGASEQAASIEETSSSLEEMSSMTKRNAESASHADNLMKDANHIVKTANESMGKLTNSMEEISKASEETSKIIKTIDEIAFQTNLLALNAAVEAARAGEAGAGFAVVADEVRNLAMRAAQAAKDTAELIEGTVKKVSQGSELVSGTNDAFEKVADSAGKVGALVAEISQASDEQSKGIDQVNIAISEMDKVVQQNAANAEESASASEELNAQAEQLRGYVSDLYMMVTGIRHESHESGRQTGAGQIGHDHKPPVKLKKGKLALGSKEVKPDQVIPFDEDEDFTNF